MCVCEGMGPGRSVGPCTSVSVSRGSGVGHPHKVLDSEVVRTNIKRNHYEGSLWEVAVTSCSIDFPYFR